ncbi:hypothetical protein HDU77_000516 [Chytriomyces hyalinus]|nr:hypothetical protein HDU77_000516 [Chytriomyces hyalinus]
MVKLEICHCGLTGSLAGIGALSRLEELDASFNDLTEGIPPNEIPQMSQLKSLHLIGNARLQGQLWDFRGSDNFKYLCMDEAVFSNCTIRGISAQRSCTVYHEEDVGEEWDSDWSVDSTLPRHQKDESIWIFLPEKYQAAMAREKLSQLEILDSCGSVKTAMPFPKSVVLLSKLTTLNLARCTLTGAIPEIFGGLSNTNMLFLILSNNQLDGVVPASFNCLSSLFLLDLSKNRLTGHLPDFSHLNALQVLRVSENQLTGPIPTCFGSPSILQYMDVGRNRFSSIPATISNLVYISYLNISYNPISSPIPKELWSLMHLVNLKMCHCGLTGSLAGIGALSRLEELDACFNDLTEGITSNEIPQMSHLKSLHLIGNARLQGQLWDFRGSENFKYLCMDHAVLENSTLCGELVPCELHGESKESQGSDIVK